MGYAQDIDHYEGTSVANFEVFTKRMVPLVKSPYVTIQKRGSFSLNASAHAALGAPRALELLYDASGRVIGLRGVEPEAPHAYPLRNATNKVIGPWIVSGSAFTKYYNIDTSVSRRWPAVLDDGVLCLHLSGESTLVIGNRGSKSNNEKNHEIDMMDDTDLTTIPTPVAE